MNIDSAIKSDGLAIYISIFLKFSIDIQNINRLSRYITKKHFNQFFLFLDTLSIHI